MQVLTVYLNVKEIIVKMWVLQFCSFQTQNFQHIYQTVLIIVILVVETCMYPNL